MADVLEFLWIGFVACVLIAVAMLGLCFGFRYPIHYYDQKDCAAFGVASGREVKFADYTFLTWDCLTPSANGKWVPTSSLRDEVDQ